MEGIDLSVKYDLVISYCFAPILKEHTIELLDTNIINVHPSYLPYGRGIYPILWSAALDNPQGVTLHTIESSQIDNGRIIAQEVCPIVKSATLAQAHKYLLCKSRSLLLEHLVNHSADLLHFSMYPDQTSASKYQP